MLQTEESVETRHFQTIVSSTEALNLLQPGYVFSISCHGDLAK